MSQKLLILACIALAVFTSSLFACNPETGERRQMIFVEADNKTVEHWEMVPGKIKELKLPNGKEVGISVAPAAPEKYLEMRASGRYVPEMVEIRIYNTEGEVAVEEQMSWGGANSVQGYSGYTINLLKPVCYTPVDIVAGN
jgi:hypothetical protein